MEAKHIDDKIQGEIQRIRVIAVDADDEAGLVLYRPCQDCYRDVLLQPYPDNSGADEVLPAQISDQFLSHRCTEKAAAKRPQCRTCGEYFEALPSHDAYTSESPICTFVETACWTRSYIQVKRCARDVERASGYEGTAGFLV
jgi:hypothetical protein